MLKIAKSTKLKPEDIIDRAIRFFGKGGEGLEEKERDPCCVTFEGGGGYVSVLVIEEDKNRTVEVETREFEFQVNRFLESL